MSDKTFIMYVRWMLWWSCFVFSMLAVGFCFIEQENIVFHICNVAIWAIMSFMNGLLAYYVPRVLDPKPIRRHGGEVDNNEYENMPYGQYVYLLQDTQVTGYYKIGMTNKPSRRFTDFGAKLPFDMRVVAVIPCKDMRALERQLHDKYEAQRVRGEWFDLAPYQVDSIKSMRGYIQ